MLRRATIVAWPGWWRPCGPAFSSLGSNGSGGSDSGASAGADAGDESSPGVRASPAGTDRVVIYHSPASLLVRLGCGLLSVKAVAASAGAVYLGSREVTKMMTGLKAASGAGSIDWAGLWAGTLPELAAPVRQAGRPQCAPLGATSAGALWGSGTFATWVVPTLPFVAWLGLALPFRALPCLALPAFGRCPLHRAPCHCCWFSGAWGLCPGPSATAGPACRGSCVGRVQPSAVAPGGASHGAVH
jgi:hypothetical protein